MMMPTGYTSPLYEGKEQTPREFILRCARAFGAATHQRDEAMDAPLRHREPHPYHAEAEAKARVKERELLAMSAAEASRRAREAHQKSLEIIDARESARRALRDRYQSMIFAVEAWEPPTPAHSELKDFLLQQLRESLKFDCGLYDHSVPVELSGEEWLRREIALARRDIHYHHAEHLKEIDRCNKANTWIDALVASLPVSEG